MRYLKVMFGLLLLTGISIGWYGCRKPYYPPVIAAGNNNYLVVEGVINAGPDSTIIKLSRTVKLDTTIGSKPELNANVTVESDAGSVYQLVQAGNGYYVAAGLNLGTDHKYRLHIVTSDNKTYQSDLVEVKNAPPIDSISHIVNSSGVRINVNTHDPANKTIYYRWSYKETYIIHSIYSASVQLIHTPFDTIVFRQADDQIYRCWRTEASSSIVLGSSAKLSQDVISENEITSMIPTSEKIGSRYSIEVTQYALTKEAYDYWQQMKKNTEQLGSIFDAQPSEISGNIHCVSNPSEPVIGYISAGSYTQSRIFIDSHDLPAWTATPYITGCKLDSYSIADGSVAKFIYTGLAFPVGAISQPGGPITGYTTSTQECVDCTLRGTNIEPAFWIDSQ